MAKYLPTHVFNTFGYRWTMNPGTKCTKKGVSFSWRGNSWMLLLGWTDWLTHYWMWAGPFRIKEHAMVTCAYSQATSVSYALGALTCLELWYGRRINAFWVSDRALCDLLLWTLDLTYWQSRGWFFFPLGHHVSLHLHVHRLWHCRSPERASGHTADHVLSHVTTQSCSLPGNAQQQRDHQKGSEILRHCAHGDFCVDVVSAVHYSCAGFVAHHLLVRPWKS